MLTSQLLFGIVTSARAMHRLIWNWQLLDTRVYDLVLIDFRQSMNGAEVKQTATLVNIVQKLTVALPVLQDSVAFVYLQMHMAM